MAHAPRDISFVLRSHGIVTCTDLPRPNRKDSEERYSLCVTEKHIDSDSKIPDILVDINLKYV